MQRYDQQDRKRLKDHRCFLKSHIRSQKVPKPVLNLFPEYSLSQPSFWGTDTSLSVANVRRVLFSLQQHATTEELNRRFQIHTSVK